MLPGPLRRLRRPGCSSVAPLVGVFSAVLVGALLAACGGGGGTPSAGRSMPRATTSPSTAGSTAGSASGSSGSTSGSTARARGTTTTTSTVPPEPGWTVLATESTGVAVDEQTVTTSDGSTVTLVRFRAGQVHYDLHDGATDPPHGTVTLGPNGQDAISSEERPLLLAAFNGGFKVTTDAGGMEVDGQDLTPLVTGMASLVVAANGAASIGVWGDDFPPAGEQVVGVRQNLPPLVEGGQPSGDVDDVAAWGATVGGTYVARSALGETSTGALVYAASSSTVPADLAQALLDVGAVTAMQLDINPDWVQADVASSPGATLTAAIPGQLPSADQYLEGWTRDFVAVLAGGPAGG